MYTLGVDCSRYQEDIDTQLLIQAGVKFVVLKATELQRAAGSVDPFFLRNKAACEAAGLLVAAYGFLDPTAGTPQADLLLKTAPHMLTAEDLEAGGDTLQEAEDFVTEVVKATGRYPMLYTAEYVLKRINGHTSPILAKCPLWLEQIGAKTPVVPLPWHDWTIWQYGYLNIGGKTFDADVFNGSLEELEAFWKGSDVTLPLVTARVVAPNDIAVYSGAGLGFKIVAWVKAGDTIDNVDQSSAKPDADNAGVIMYQIPDDRWVDSRALQFATNVPPPVPTPVVRYVTSPNGLNVRNTGNLDSAGSPTGKVLSGLPNGTKVSVIVADGTGKKMDALISPVINGGLAFVADWFLDTVPPR